MPSLLDGIYASFASGDAAAYLAAIADDIVGIGTDEAEWWVGRAAVGPVMEAQLREMSSAGISVHPGVPVIAEHGDVVWAADRPTLTLGDGTSLELRMTLVATREDAGLRIRQMHLSMPAPNEEVVQMELTTDA